MFACVHSPKDVPSGNKGSCASLATYLSKDDDTSVGFFSHFEERVSYDEVVISIDENVAALGKDDSKFYMLSLNPSHDELCAIIGRPVNSIEELTQHERDLIESRLIEHTRKAMDAYAANFGRDSVKSGADLIYYARIETSRLYKPTSDNIAAGAKIGSEKGGLNYHVHVIVSRKSADGKVKLSPQVVSRGNDWMLDGKVVRRGFNHESWKMGVQAIWDRDNGVSNDRYIPREDSIYRANNADLAEIINSRYSNTNALLEEMRIVGYDVKQYGDVIRFSREGERFNVSRKDLRARETVFSEAEKSALYERYLSGQAEARDMMVSVKNQETGTWEDKPSKYIRGHEGTVRLRDAEMSYAKLHGRQYNLGKMPEDMQQVFNTHQASSYRDIIPEVEKLGYIHQQEGAKHTFVKEETKVVLYHSDLKCLEGVSIEAKRSIAERLDIDQAYLLKDGYLPDKGLSIEERTIEGVETPYYVVKDERTNSCVTLGEIRREHISLRRGEHVPPMAESDSEDIRALSQCKRLKEDILITRMKNKGYEVKKNKYDIEFSKDGRTYQVSKGEISRLRRSKVDKAELRDMWVRYQNGELQAEAYTERWVDRATGVPSFKKMDYIVSDTAIVPIWEVIKAWRNGLQAEQLLSSMPPVFREAFTRGEYYSCTERFEDITSAGYTYQRVKDEHVFTKDDEVIRLRHRDLRLFDGVSDDAKRGILAQVDFRELYRSKDSYLGQHGISVERRELPNDVSYYVVKDAKNDVVVKLSDLRELWQRDNPTSNLYERTAKGGKHLGAGMSAQRIGSQVAHKLLPGEVKQAMSGVYMAQSVVGAVSNPALAIKKQLLQAVKKIALSAFKEV